MSRASVGATVLKNTMYITAGSLALKLLNFAFRVFVVRQLGAEVFGQYSIVVAFVGLMQIGAELGISQWTMREIARDRSATDRLFGNLVALRLVLAVISVGVLTVAGIGAGYSAVLVWGIFFYSLTFIISAFEAPLEVLLTAHERFDYISLLSVVGQVSFAVLGTIVLLLDYGLIAFVAIGLVAMLPQLALAVRLVRRHHMLPTRIRVRPSEWPYLIRMGIPFGIISLALTIAFSIDTVVLSWFWPAYAVGWYNAAYGLARSLLFVFGGFSTALVPSLSHTYVNDVRTVEMWYFRTTRMITLIGLPIAVGGMLVAYPLLTFLYGEQFAPAASAFQILVWDVPLLMFASFCGNMTTVVNEERSAARIYMINAGANVVLNLIFIPTWGILAASVITVLTDLLATLQFHLVLSKKLNLPSMSGTLIRVAAAAALMGVCVYLCRSLPLFVQMGVGAVSYGVLVLALRIPDQADWALARRIVRRGKAVVTPMLGVR